MKTLTSSTSKHFFNYKFIQPLCEKLFTYFSLLLPELLPQVAIKNQSNSQNSKTKGVSLTYQAGRVVSTRLQNVAIQANVIISEAWTNKRFRLGVLLISFALPCFLLYRVFDMGARMDGFYYVNYFFYFYTIKGYLAVMFLMIGAFIAMPQKWAFRWWCVPVAIFCASEIYRESLFTHWKDFYTDYPSWQMLLVFGMSVPALYVSANYLLYRKYHLKDGTAARIIGVAKSPGLTTEEKMNLIEKLVKESEEFNSRI